ncbi:hypothetical protein ACWCQS_41945 [Streptomyces sp. NPDC002076]
MPADLASSKCVYDDRNALVCFGTGPEGLLAYGLDASNGKDLWQLPDQQADRIAPQVTAVWHGRVYGTTDHGTVTLDARTGKDLPNPGVAPYLVNESAGLALDKKRFKPDRLPHQQLMPGGAPSDRQRSGPC